MGVCTVSLEDKTWSVQFEHFPHTDFDDDCQCPQKYGDGTCHCDERDSLTMEEDLFKLIKKMAIEIDDLKERIESLEKA
jgi:hypothetical protein